jgi:hypothetical protein
MYKILFIEINSNKKTNSSNYNIYLFISIIIYHLIQIYQNDIFDIVGGLVPLL